MKVKLNFVLGDFVTNDPGEWGRDYSDDLAKSSESKDVTKLQMSEAKKVDVLLKTKNVLSWQPCHCQDMVLQPISLADS